MSGFRPLKQSAWRGHLTATQDMTKPYNPLDYRNLAQNVVRALLERTDSEIPPQEPFVGSGVYALYYTGPLPYYAFLASEDLGTPIYVGKAVPSGSRKGSYTEVPKVDGSLYRRLCEHAKSIDQAENLRLEEFRCRFLVVETVWITLAERFLINHFKPVWNTVIDGFGNLVPGRGASRTTVGKCSRRRGKRSRDHRVAHYKRLSQATRSSTAVS